MPGAAKFLDDPKMHESLVNCGVGYSPEGGEKSANIVAGKTEIEPGEEQEGQRPRCEGGALSACEILEMKLHST